MRLAAGALVAIVSLLAALAVAAPGDLDPGFGSGGRVVVTLPSQSHLGDLASQPDGKIVAVGFTGLDGLVLRLRDDGTPDLDFGVDGRVVIPSALATHLALAPGGDVLVAGISVAPPLAIFVARLRPNGTFDPAFGTGGIVTTSIWVFPPGGETAQAEPGVCGLAVTSDGAIVVGLSIAVESSSAFFNATGAVRYGSTGILDGGFGGASVLGTSPIAPGGVAAAPAVSDFGFCASMALDAAGGILLGGQQVTFFVPPQPTFAPTVARLDAAGDPDIAFGASGDGVAFVPGFTGAGSNSTVRAIAPNAMGGAVVAGSGFDLARYDAAGIPDPAFGTGGVADLPGLYPSNDLALDAGYVLAAGRRFTDTPIAIDVPFALMRTFADGSLDTGFGSGGVASTTFAGWPLTTASQLALDAQGHAIVGGTLVATSGAGEGFALARLVGGASPPTTETTTTTSSTTTTTTLAPGTPLAGARLMLAGSADPDRRRIAVASDDAAVGLAVGVADDPRFAGGTLRVRLAAGAGGDATFDLPASGWSALWQGGDLVGWRYRDATGPIRRVVLQRGRRLELRGGGAALPYTLSARPDPVRIDLALGEEHHCLEFGGEVRFRAGQSFRARRAPAPVVCP
jgi:uncharacterized delta-60 repeat protein